MQATSNPSLRQIHRELPPDPAARARHHRHLARHRHLTPRVSASPRIGTKRTPISRSRRMPFASRSMRSSSWSRPPTGSTRRPPTRELVDQRLRHVAGSGRHDDRVEGRLLGPAAIAVADAHVHVRVAEPRQVGARPLAELLHDLDRVDLARELGEHRRLVARAGPDLEHALVAAQPQLLRHVGHHVRLRDRLAAADRERPVFVGVVAQLVGHQLVARNAREIAASTRGSRMPRRGDLLAHHALAGLGRRRRAASRSASGTPGRAERAAARQRARTSAQLAVSAASSTGNSRSRSRRSASAAAPVGSRRQ